MGNIDVREGTIFTLTLVLLDGTREEGYLPSDFLDGHLRWQFSITRSMTIERAEVYGDGVYLTNSDLLTHVVAGDTYTLSVKLVPPKKKRRWYGT